MSRNDPSPERRIAANSVLITQPRPGLDPAEVRKAIEDEADPRVLADILYRMYHHHFQGAPADWKPRLLEYARSEHGELRQWAKILLVSTFFSLGELLALARETNVVERREEWTLALVRVLGGGGWQFKEREAPREGVSAAVIELLRLTNSASVRRQLLRLAPRLPLEEAATFYREAGLIEPAPDLRAAMERLLADLKADPSASALGLADRHFRKPR
jgi:hypothetical protein